MKQIQFQNNFDCILCLNADLPDFDFFRKTESIPVYAADGAASGLLDIGIVPDFIVGDLDSFIQTDYVDRINPEKIIHIPEQDTNDFEKILKVISDKSYNNIVIIGFHGGELEHTLNNWSVFRRYSRQTNLCIYDKERFGISVFRDVKLNLKKSELVSLIPQPEAILSTYGLKWELKREVLAIGKREGARNVCLNGDIEINIHSGEILLFFDERLPKSPF